MQTNSTSHTHTLHPVSAHSLFSLPAMYSHSHTTCERTLLRASICWACWAHLSTDCAKASRSRPNSSVHVGVCLFTRVRASSSSCAHCTDFCLGLLLRTELGVFTYNRTCFCPGIIPSIANYFQQAPDWSSSLALCAHVLCAHDLTGSAELGLEQFDVLMLRLVFSVEVLDVLLQSRSNTLVCYQRRRTGSLDVQRMLSSFVCGPLPAGARYASDRDICTCI
jgi:hypothetical protein